MRKNKSPLFYIIALWLSYCSCSNESKTSVRTDSMNMMIEVIGNDTFVVKKNNTGVITSKIQIKKNKYKGFATFYHLNGTIAETGRLEDSIKIGVWKSYSTNNLLLNIAHYSKGKKAFDLDTKDFLMKDTVLPESKIQISYPQSWLIKNIRGGMILAISKNCSDSFAFCPNLVITKDKIPQQGFDAVVESIPNLLNAKYDKIKIMDEQKVMIHGLRAFKYRFMSMTDNFTLGHIMTLIEVDNEVYILSGAASNQIKGDYLRYDGVFDEIAESFEVKKGL